MSELDTNREAAGGQAGEEHARPGMWTVLLLLVLVLTIASLAFAAIRGLAHRGDAAVGSGTASPAVQESAASGQQQEGKGTQTNLHKLSEYYREGFADQYVDASGLSVLGTGTESGMNVSEFAEHAEGHKALQWEGAYPKAFENPVSHRTASGLPYVFVEGVGPYFVSEAGIPFGYGYTEPAAYLEAINFTLLFYHAQPEEKIAIVEAYCDRNNSEIQELIGSIRAFPDSYSPEGLPGMTLVGYGFERNQYDQDVRRHKLIDVYVRFDSPTWVPETAAKVSYYRGDTYRDEEDRLYIEHVFPMDGVNFERIAPVKAYEDAKANDPGEYVALTAN